MGEMRTAPIVKGLLTLIPGISDLLPSKSPGHTDSAAYCYDVWFKHLTLLSAHGLREVPETIAELGPGESIGVGLAALLSGSKHYIGLDVTAHSNTQRNLDILEQLVGLYRQRAGRPVKGWPDIEPYLDERLFPGHILPEEHLKQALANVRIDGIRAAIKGSTNVCGIKAEYKAPWSDPSVLVGNCVDLVISQSVLEHVVDLEGTYRALYHWMKPGAWMSHQIDLRSHGLTRRWNGFRTCSDRVWKMTVGRRKYMINRAPASTHLRLIESAGFQLVHHQELVRDDGVKREELSPRWADISERDLTCSSVYVIARK